MLQYVLSCKAHLLTITGPKATEFLLNLLCIIIVPSGGTLFLLPHDVL